MFGSTSANRSAFAPAARNDRAETSLGRKPRLIPMDLTACWMVRVILRAVMDVISSDPWVNRRANGVPGGAL